MRKLNLCCQTCNSEFFLIHSSIKQFPGPISLLNISKDPIGFFIIVKFDIPPIFKIQMVDQFFFFEEIN